MAAALGLLVVCFVIGAGSVAEGVSAQLGTDSEGNVVALSSPGKSVVCRLP